MLTATLNSMKQCEMVFLIISNRTTICRARAGVNVKATQYVMGHAHSDVTMDVYNHLNNKTDVKLEFSKFEKNGTKMVQ